MKPKLLIVDDDEAIRTQLRWSLEGDYELLLAEDRSSALEMVQQAHPAVVLLDLGLPPQPTGPEEGLATLSEMLTIDPLTKVVIVTGQTEKPNALQAIGAGAYDLLCKPVEITELRLVLKRCFYLTGLEHENRRIQQSATDAGFEGMLGSSPVMQEVFASVRKLADVNVPVLILGESGTGKEMVARAIHQRSARRQGPFVAINCGAIPENLIESELFGHERGSFTGAHAQRRGRIEMADGGTLFLDEIGELPLLMQVKLLRFVQEQSIERIGGRSTISVDTRIVSATNVDLEKAMGDGEYREDLYYRLAVMVIRMPALRDRPGDIPLLAKVFLRRFKEQNNLASLEFSAGAIRALQGHDWPGNVRELENRVKRAAIMAEGRRVTPADLELAHRESPNKVRSLKDVRTMAEREAVELAMQRNQGKISRAAQELGVSRPTLYELLEKLGLRKPDRDEHE